MTMTPEEKIIEARRKRFTDLATLLYGKRFGQQLAEAIGVSQGLISHIVTKRRDVTEDLERRLAAHAQAYGAQLAARSVQIAQATSELKKSLGEPEFTVSTSTPKFIPVGDPLFEDDYTQFDEPLPEIKP